MRLITLKTTSYDKNLSFSYGRTRRKVLGFGFRFGFRNNTRKLLAFTYSGVLLRHCYRIRFTVCELYS